MSIRCHIPRDIGRLVLLYFLRLLVCLPCYIQSTLRELAIDNQVDLLKQLLPRIDTITLNAYVNHYADVNIPTSIINYIPLNIINFYAG